MQHFNKPVDLSMISCWHLDPFLQRQKQSETIADEFDPEIRMPDMIRRITGTRILRKMISIVSSRISSWIHRRFNKPIQVVADELERLVSVGELARWVTVGPALDRLL